ncbi:MAG: AIDA repeat-containing protein [Victivallaceae bacterium]|nr:AIDA repeat-containing protein [Victivallaceae bacterium]
MSAIYIPNAETAIGEIISSGGSMLVASGGTANSTTVSSGGSILIACGGIVNQTRIDSGGIINGFTLHNQNYYVEGIRISNAIVKNKDSAAIYNGQFTSDTFIDSGGCLYVSSGGTTKRTRVSAGGNLYVSSSGEATVTTVDYSGNLTIFLGGTASSTTVCYYGSMTVSSGGTANNTAIEGFVYVLQNGVANVNTVSSCGSLFVSGTAKSTTVNSGGGMFVASGGTANDIIISSHGNVSVFCGGTANSTTASSGGYMTLASGGTADNTTIHSGGWMSVSNGGMAKNTTVNSGGSINGFLIQESNYYAEGIHISKATASNGVICDGQTGTDILVSSGGKMFVYEGGSVHNTTVESGGIINGFTAEEKNCYSDGIHISNAVVKNDRSGSCVLYHGQTATMIAVSSLLAVYSGGAVDHAMINDSGCLLVCNGGSASDICFNFGGGMLIRSGGTVYTTTVTAGGGMFVDGTANSTTVSSGGSMFVSLGGAANSTTVHSGGRMIVSGSAGMVRDTKVDSGGIMNGFTIQQANDYAEGVHISNAIASSGIVYDGQTATGVTVESGAYMYVASGGSATGTSIASGGLMHITLAANTLWTGTSAGKVFAYSSSATGLCLSREKSLTVSEGGVAYNMTVSSGGVLTVSADGKAYNIVASENTTINGFFFMSEQFFSFLDAEGVHDVVHGAVVGKAETARIGCNGVANQTSLYSYGACLHISSGGTANETSVRNGEIIVFENGTACDTWIGYSGNVYVSSAGVVNNTTVDSVGRMCVSGGGTANSTTINLYGSISISGGTANASIVNSGGRMEILAGGVAHDTTVYSGGHMRVACDSKVSGTWQITSGAVILVSSGTRIDFSVAQRATADGALIANWNLISGGNNADYTLTVKADQRSGTYQLATGAADFSNSISVRTVDDIALGTLSVGGMLALDHGIYFLTRQKDQLLLKIKKTLLEPDNLVGIPAGLTWNDGSGATGYVVEYSTDAFAHAIRLNVATNRVDSFRLPNGFYSWRVRAANGDEWVMGENILSDNAADSPKLLAAVEDGNADLFFANASGIWTGAFLARHAGNVNHWRGMDETVAIYGKNRFADLFAGSEDANILYLTDDANGDALFVDDIYTNFPGSVAEQQARLARINEIRAGAGDDLVDMTSQRFKYTGDGLIIRGGDGDDTIWANTGDNLLFGDAGNDRLVGASGNDVLIGGSGNDSMHGGGGNDLFVFGENWGFDTVEQFATGSVTLWFESGDLDHWNARTRTYTDAKNSVTVHGVANIALKFGDDGSSRFDSLVALGAFAERSSQKIFEDQEQGVLADLS